LDANLAYGVVCVSIFERSWTLLVFDVAEGEELGSNLLWAYPVRWTARNFALVRDPLIRPA